MKIIIITEKYGGFCNRLFQSLHYHAYSLEKKIKFFNPSMLGILKFDNYFFYFLDSINNFLLRSITKLFKIIFGKNEICLYFNRNNYIKFVNGWDFRKYKLSTKHHKVLKTLYSFDKRYFSRKSIKLLKFLINKKKDGKFIIGIHIRRGDYNQWNEGKYYFDDDFYKDVINKLKKNLINENKDPFVVVVSDEKIISDIGANFYSEGSWKQDQITLQSCDLIVGPPSTFTMWASYISQVPLIKLNANKNLTKAVVCRG